MSFRRLLSPYLSTRTLCVLLVALLLATACACAGSSTSSSHPPGNSGPSVHSTSIHVHSASSQVLSNAARTAVSVACSSDEQMIGGGFSASYSFEYDVMITSSYPSGVNGWTVVAGSSPAFALEAEVYCLPAAPALGVQIVHAPMAESGSVACPTGTTLLGGGSQATEVVTASRPQDNGWYAATISTSGQVYALCASQQVTAGSIATTTYNPHSSSHSYAPGSAVVSCPLGQLPTGGGFSGGDLLLASESDGAPYTSWTVTAGGDVDATFSVVCVSLAT